MKYLFLFLTISLFAHADEPSKKQEPLTVMAPKSLAKYDPNNGEWTLEKGAKPEEVMTALLREISSVQAALQKCEAEKQPAKKSK